MAGALPGTGTWVVGRPCLTVTIRPWWMRLCPSAPGTAAPIEEIVAALDAAYRTVGFEVQVLDAEGRKGHLLVTFPLGGTYRVDVLKEPLNHPVVWMEFGPVIALADTVALKMGAL